MSTHTETTAPTVKVISIERRTWWGRGSTQRRGADRPDGKSICYFDFSALDSDVWEQIINRRHRPYREVRPFVEAALREAGIEFEKTRWNQRAGCDCPCSPGFVLEGAVRGFDYWVGIPRATD